MRSVYTAFRPFNGGYITRFAKDAASESRMIDEGADPTVRRVIDTVWAATRQRSAVELARMTQRENSAWDTAFQNQEPFLSFVAIVGDETYRHDLGLVAADAARTRR